MIRVITLVFTFLIRLRFPPGKGFVEVLKSRYDLSALSQFRTFERLDQKWRKISLDLDFLQTCKQHETIPKFLYHKVYNYNVTSTLFYKAFLFRLLDFEIKQKTKALKRTETELEKARSDFSNKVSRLDFTILCNRMLSNNITKTRKIKIVHQKKLMDLGISPFANVDLNKVVTNLSKRKLSEDEITILSHGLSFALPNRKINYVDHFFSFEKFLQGLRSKTISNECKMTKDDLLKFITSTAHTTFSEFNGIKHTFPKLPDNHLKALKDLKNDTTITITRPDKGRGTVVLDKKEYLEEMEKILSDTTKFKPISEDAFTVITKVEDRLQRFLRKLLAENSITKNTYQSLFANGSNCGCLYGLPKTHKRGKLTFRPILSALGTFNYNLAKYFVPILEPLTKNECTVKNSYEFVNEVSEIKLDQFTMASLDVTSLFTQIPLDETIDIICDSLFKENAKFKKLTKPQFKELLNFAVKDSPFQFNNKLYTQVDGVAMGSPLGPTFANCFMCFHEEKWLDDCPLEFRPLYYRRYVDDCFVLFRKPEHIPKFQNYLNSKHANIKFTVEHESDGTLPFLDVLLTRNRNQISTSIYRKPTFTGLGLNFLSFVPENFKINAIKTLLYRCYHLSSDWKFVHMEIDYLTNFFKNNHYPLHVIHRNIRNFLNKTILPTQSVENQEQKEKLSTHYVSLPFYGCLSYDIRKKLTRVLKHCYPNTNFRFIFTNGNNINSMFRHKEPLPFTLISNIVYQYNCSRCNSRYIGKTTRNLTLRFAEHAGISARSGSLLSSPPNSAIRDHTQKMEHPLLLSDFKILHSARNGMDLPLLESLYIHHLKPDLNIDLTSCPLLVLK